MIFVTILSLKFSYDPVTKIEILVSIKQNEP